MKGRDWFIDACVVGAQWMMFVLHGCLLLGASLAQCTPHPKQPSPGAPLAQCTLRPVHPSPSPSAPLVPVHPSPGAPFTWCTPHPVHPSPGAPFARCTLRPVRRVAILRRDA